MEVHAFQIPTYVERYLEGHGCSVLKTDDLDQYFSQVRGMKNEQGKLPHSVLLCNVTKVQGMDPPIERKLRGEIRVEVPLVGLLGEADGRIAPSQRAHFLSRGGDYLLPYSAEPAEIFAYLKSSLRSFLSPQPTHLLLCLDGRLKVNPLSGDVYVDEKRVHFTRTEHTILSLLASRPGFVFAKDKIYDAIYQGRVDRQPRTIDVVICKLRRRLKDAGLDPLSAIQAEWGRGYKLQGPSQLEFAGIY